MRRIKPRNNNGRIILQFTNPITKKRESITCGDWNNKTDRRHAENLAETIYTDYLKSQFDSTLDSYRLAPKRASEPAKTLSECLAKARELKPSNSNIYTVCCLQQSYGDDVSNRPQADKFWDYLKADRKTSTANRYLAVLRVGFVA
jgi:hypothetical protein